MICSPNNSVGAQAGVSAGINAPEELSANQIQAIRTNLQPGWHFPHKPRNLKYTFEDIEIKIWSSVLN